MKSYEIPGLINDINDMSVIPTTFVIMATNSPMGKTLSICHEKTGIMFTVSFEPIEEVFREDGSREKF